MPTKKTVAKKTATKKKATTKKSTASKEVKNPILEDEATEEKEADVEEEVDQAELEEQKIVEKQVKSVPTQAPKEVMNPVSPQTASQDMKEYLDRVARTREKLMNGPQTQFVIPLAPGEKVGAVETVSINGWKLTIKKGALVTIPVAVMQVLANYYKVSTEAGQDKLIDRDDRTLNALG